MSSLLEPCAVNSRTHGSEGRGGQQCPSLTRACSGGWVKGQLLHLTNPSGGEPFLLNASYSFIDINYWCT